MGVENEGLFWIPRKDEGERLLAFEETQWIVWEIVEERGGAEPDECYLRLKEAKEWLQRFFSFTSVMVKVKGGTFQMGNTREGGKEEDREKPVHAVTLTYDFWLGKYPVTFYEYDAYCAATGSDRLDYAGGWRRGRRPAIGVFWRNAIEYYNWLSDKEGIAKAYDGDGNLLGRDGKVTEDIMEVEGYRLPTEAEWEYAARGGTKLERIRVFRKQRSERSGMVLAKLRGSMVTWN